MKTKTNLTVLIDRSGSMANLWSDVIGGINSYVDTQKDVPGE